jgi:hypothetical protein
MMPATTDRDSYLCHDGSWTSDLAQAHRFGMRIAAENCLVSLGHGDLELVEE